MLGPLFSFDFVKFNWVYQSLRDTFDRNSVFRYRNYKISLQVELLNIIMI